MNPLLRKNTLQTDISSPNRYEKLGLIENPFPREPTLVPDSPDPRVNGSIYSDQLHQDKADRFRELLIPTSERRPLRSITFLMDHASRRGRGIGKSAFLKHQQQQIMADFGSAASGGVAVLFAAYIVPTTSPSCRKFWEFARLIAQNLNSNYIIAKAIWRIRALSGELPDSVLENIGTQEEWEQTIGRDEWLRTQGVDTWRANGRVKNHLASFGIPSELAQDLALVGGEPGRMRDQWFIEKNDSFWRRDGGQFVFDVLVKLFKAADFSRGVLLVDELEKIVVHQNSIERLAFVESLRFFFLDGNCQNAKDRFFGLLLTIHPLVQELLLGHWKTSGLDRLAPLNEPEAKDSTLYFPPLDRSMAIPLVTVYLDHFRLDSGNRNSIKPFTEDAVADALLLAGQLPGKTLQFLHRVIEEAADAGVDIISKEFVQRHASGMQFEVPGGDEQVPLPQPEATLTEPE